jgi:hypothetical protein
MMKATDITQASVGMTSATRMMSDTQHGDSSWNDKCYWKSTRLSGGFKTSLIPGDFGFGPRAGLT